MLEDREPPCCNVLERRYSDRSRRRNCPNGRKCPSRQAATHPQMKGGRARGMKADGWTLARIFPVKESCVPDSENPDSSSTTSLILWSLWLLAGVALVIGGALVSFPSHTDRYFAWPIRAPIAASTLGAWYLGLGVFALRLSRPLQWSTVRLVMPIIGFGATIMLVATILHRASFAWGSPAAWVWLLLYLVAPPGFVRLSLRMAGSHTETPGIHGPLPAALRGVLIGAAATFGVIGATLFLQPMLLIPHWPWPLTPLVARAYSAFILAYSLLAGLVARVSSGDPATIPLSAIALFPLLAFAAPWLHAGTFRAANPAGIVYLIITGGTSLACAWAMTVVRRRNASPVIRG
jgi:hypothetical protein